MKDSLFFKFFVGSAMLLMAIAAIDIACDIHKFVSEKCAVPVSDVL